MGAAAAYGQALPLAPGDHRLLVNQGHALWMADLPQAAERCYRRAVALAPGSAEARCGLGHCLRDLNRFEEADAMYASAEGCQARLGRSQVLIGLEAYDEGFAAAEARLEVEHWEPFRPAPFWGGTSLDGLEASQDLWIWTEQGFGDTFQFLRWVPVLAEARARQALEGGGRAGELHLVVEPALVRILREGLAWMESPPQVLAKDALRFEPLSCHGPLMGLPHQLGGAPLPAPDAALLRSPLWSAAGPSLLPERQAAGERVGIVWASGRKLEDPFAEREYRKRSLPGDALWRLVAGLQAAGADVVPLQFGDDVDLAAALGFELAWPRLELGDFAQVARVVAQLDLVISVDTAMAHLLGALGAPGWILLPWSADPRWLRQRDDSPWHPSLRLFRQPSGGAWAEAIDGLLRAFDERTGAEGGSRARP